MEKVYILTIDDVNEDFNTLEILVFNSLEKAKKHLEKIKNEFIADVCCDEDEIIIEEDETSWTWYYDGEYNSNHYILTIHEKEIIK